MAAYKTADGKEIANWDEYLEQLIMLSEQVITITPRTGRLIVTGSQALVPIHSWVDWGDRQLTGYAFKPALLKSMRVSHLLCFLDIKEVKDRAGIIHQKENSGDYRGASEDLLESIRRADELGKWQMFIDALREVEDSVILQILMEEKDSPTWLNDYDNRQIIHIFSCIIQEYLNLSKRLLGKMWEKRLIFKKDKDRLQSLIDRGKKEDANSALLLIMHRHSADWYHTFLGILCDDEHHAALAELIDEEFCKKRRNPQAESAQESKAESSTDTPLSSLPTFPYLEQSEGHPEVNLAAPVSSKEKLPQTEQVKGHAEEVNLAVPASPGEKVTGKKGLPPVGLHDRGGDGVTPSSPDPVPPSPQQAATCQCLCCAEVLSRMTSLQSELDEMKALIRLLINKGQE